MKIPKHRRIIPIETDPHTIWELRRYDRGRMDKKLSERALRALDIITMPKNSDDRTATVLGFVATIADQHPSTLTPREHVTTTDVLVGTSRPFISRSVEIYPGVPCEKAGVHIPDGVYTLIPEEDTNTRPEAIAQAA